MTHNEQSPTVGIGEAARRLGVSETRVRQLIEQHKLSTYRTDKGHRQIRRESLEKLAASRMK